METLKQVGVIAWLTGIAALIALATWSGIDAVGGAIASVGWGTPLVVMTRAVTVSVAGAGWWLLFPASGRLQLWIAVLLRFIREAANALLPLAQVGGDMIGARLLTFRAVPGSSAAASIIVDVLIQAATQFLFAMLGLVTLVALGADMTIAGIAAIGLAVAAPMLGGFYFAQRRGGHRVLQFVLGRLTGDRNWRVLGTVDSVYQSLTLIYARPSGLLASGVVHMTGWLLGVTEVLIVFVFMGHPVTIGEALVIESLVHAIRGAAFAIPGALGAQEAGLILLCAIFGIPPEQAMALSLVKRAADLVLGVPGLLGWQILEGRRHAANYSRREAKPRGSLDLRSKNQEGTA